jgi:hypothetical protein
MILWLCKAKCFCAPSKSPRDTDALSRLAVGSGAAEAKFLARNSKLRNRISATLETSPSLCFQLLTPISNRYPLSIRTAQKAKSALSVTSAGTLCSINQSLNYQLSILQSSIKRERQFWQPGLPGRKKNSTFQTSQRCSTRLLPVKASAQEDVPQSPHGLAGQLTP